MYGMFTLVAMGPPWWFMVHPCWSMVVPWWFHDGACPCIAYVELPWLFHGVSTSLPCCSHGGVRASIASMALPWCFLGASMRLPPCFIVLPWCFHGLPLSFHGNVRAFMVLPWRFHGAFTVFPCNHGWFMMLSWCLHSMVPLCARENGEVQTWLSQALTVRKGGLKRHPRTQSHPRSE